MPQPNIAVARSAIEGIHRSSGAASSRLLKKSFASTGKDGVVAVVEGQLNLDRAVVLEFG